MHQKSHWLYTLAMVLLIIGGLNWGLVGAFNFDLVAAILGPGSMGARIVYIVVGLSAIVAAVGHMTHARERPETSAGYGPSGSTQRTVPRV